MSLTKDDVDRLLANALAATAQGGNTNDVVNITRSTLLEDMSGDKEAAQIMGRNLYGAGILTGFLNDNPEILYNLPSSTAQLAEDVVQPVLSPVETFVSFKDFSHGLLSKLGVVDSKDKEALVDAVSDHYKNRYGSFDGFMNSLRTDPAGVVADVTGLVTGGLTVAARAPGKVGQLAKEAAETVSAADPVNVAGRVLGEGADLAGAGLKVGLGLHTGVGDAPIQGVFDAARQRDVSQDLPSEFQRFSRSPNIDRSVDPQLEAELADIPLLPANNRQATMQQALEAFSAPNRRRSQTAQDSAASAAAMRKDTNPFDIVEDFDDGVELFKKQAQSQYLHGKSGLGLNDLQADYAPIDDFVRNDLGEIVYPEGLKGETPFKTELGDFTNLYKSLKTQVNNYMMNPNNQSVASMDGLKKSMDIMISQLPENVPSTVSAIFYKARRKVRDEIERLAPEYGEVMRPYEEAQELLNEFRTEFRAGNEQSSNQVLRKLQQSLRSNVNTNFGEKLNLLKQIDDLDEATSIVASLSGRAMSELTPAGLSRIAGPAAGFALGLSGQPVLAGLSLAASSPRIVGEVTRGAGIARGLLDRYEDPISVTARGSRFAGSLLDPIQEEEERLMQQSLIDQYLPNSSL